MLRFVIKEPLQVPATAGDVKLGPLSPDVDKNVVLQNTDSSSTISEKSEHLNMLWHKT